MKRPCTLFAAVLITCLLCNVRAAASQPSADKVEARVADNPDQVAVQVSIRKPSDLLVTNLSVVGYPQTDSTQLKKYNELKGCIAVVGRLTPRLDEKDPVKPPYLQGIAQVPDECRHLLNKGRYRYAAWTWDHNMDVFLADDGTIYTGTNGALTFVWFVPSGTTNIDMVFPDHKPVRIELRPSK